MGSELLLRRYGTAPHCCWWERTINPLTARNACLPGSSPRELGLASRHTQAARFHLAL